MTHDKRSPDFTYFFIKVKNLVVDFIKVKYLVIDLFLFCSTGIKSRASSTLPLSHSYSPVVVDLYKLLYISLKTKTKTLPFLPYVTNAFS